jgi:hypothetical protein
LRQWLQRAAAVDDRQQVEFVAARRIRATRIGPLRQQKMLPSSPHRVERGARLIGQLLFRVVLLPGRQLQSAFAVLHDGGPGELSAHRGLQVLDRSLIDGEKREPIPITALSGALVLQNVGTELYGRRICLPAALPGGGRQDRQRGLKGVVDRERIVGRRMHAKKTRALVALLAAQQRDDLTVDLVLR